MRYQTVGLVEELVLVMVAHVFREESGEKYAHLIAHERRLIIRKQNIGHSTEEDKTRPLTSKEKDMLTRLAAKPREEVNTADPDARLLPPEKWAKAVIDKFYRPIKKGVYLLVDADVLAQ